MHAAYPVDEMKDTRFPFSYNIIVRKRCCLVLMLTALQQVQVMFDLFVGSGLRDLKFIGFSETLHRVRNLRRTGFRQVCPDS